MTAGVWSRMTRAHTIPNGFSKAVFPDGFLVGGKFFPGNANAKVLEKEALSLYEKNDLKEALECVEFGLLHDSGVELVNLQASILNELREFKRSLQASFQVIALDPGNGKAWVNKASALLGLGDFTGALDSVTRALGINPNDDEGWCVRGTICLRMGRRNEARQCLDMAQSLNPGAKCLENLDRMLTH